MVRLGFAELAQSAVDYVWMQIGRLCAAAARWSGWSASEPLT